MISNYSKLDLAFVVDSTGSMNSYIDHAKRNINAIADELKRSEKCDLKIGVISYRDHPPQERSYVTKIHNLTADVKKTKQFITAMRASGGGDFPEAVCCGLGDCLNKLKWRDDAVKVAILIADAPPHGLDFLGDAFKNGCPKKVDPVEVAHEMAKRGITLYCAGCEPSLFNFRQFFIALCLITGGQYVPLDDSENLTNVIIGGAREDISMEKLMAQVHNEYMKEVSEKGKRVDEDELTRRIHNVLNSKSENKINQIKTGNTVKIDENSTTLSKTNTLDEMVKLAKQKKITLTTYSEPKVEECEDKKEENSEDDDCKPGSKRKRATRGRPPSSKKVAKTTAKKSTRKSIRKTPASGEEENVASKSTADKEPDEVINVDQARRLVKKALARNKLD